MLSYDPQSNSLSSEDANGDVTVFTFGEDSAVRTFEDSGGNAYGFEEDNEQRITRLDFPDSSSIQLSYVGNGSQLLSEVIRRSGTRVEYIYDSNDNLVSVIYLYIVYAVAIAQSQTSDVSAVNVGIFTCCILCTL